MTGSRVWLLSLTSTIVMPVIHRFINRHVGVPEPAADVVTTNVAKSLRSYFLGVTIIAAFNGIVIGAAALIMAVVALLANGALQQRMVGLTLAAPLPSAAVHIANELRERRVDSTGVRGVPRAVPPLPDPSAS